MFNCWWALGSFQILTQEQRCSEHSGQCSIEYSCSGEVTGSQGVYVFIFGEAIQKQLPTVMFTSLRDSNHELESQWLCIFFFFLIVLIGLVTLLGRSWICISLIAADKELLFDVYRPFRSPVYDVLIQVCGRLLSRASHLFMIYESSVYSMASGFSLPSVKYVWLSCFSHFIACLFFLSMMFFFWWIDILIVRVVWVTFLPCA